MACVDAPSSRNRRWGKRAAAVDIKYETESGTGELDEQKEFEELALRCEDIESDDEDEASDSDGHGDRPTSTSAGNGRSKKRWSGSGGAGGVNSDFNAGAHGTSRALAQLGSSSNAAQKHNRSMQPHMQMRRGVCEMDVAMGLPRPASALAQMVAELEARLGPASVRRAQRDQHSRRRMIPCGMPLLTGHSCDYACRYCYIQDFYPFVAPTPSPLSGEEVLLSLLYNRHWTPGRDFIILGDVCDPFHPNLQARSLEFIRAVAPLRSPIQFCTKTEVSEAIADELADISKTNQCPFQALVTITTIRHAPALEPVAPSVEKRLTTIRRLAARGLGVFVFMRPLIPGVTTDFEDVLAAARDAGAIGVVVGSLRVSKKIYRRLRLLKAPIDIEEIDRQLRSSGIEPDELTENQVDIQDEPVRAKVKACAERLGLATVRRACCANAFVAGITCGKPRCLMADVCAAR